MLKIWMVDFAREQSPSLDHLRIYCRTAIDSGFDALGMYLEHRFRYESAPWAAGIGAIQPSDIATLRREFPDLRLIPFVNLLGHMEGFVYTEQGRAMREAKFEGMQACPSNPDTVRLANALVDDIMGVFDDEIVHIGGDETWQLGQCPKCGQRVRESDETGMDGKAALYAEHFGPIAERVVRSGRSPAVWGDMFLEHPQAMESLPSEAIVFDWQYFGGLENSSPTFTQRGFRTVGCPTLQTYNAAWFHLERSQENVRAVLEDCRRFSLYGFCLTTWEMGLFGSYDTIFPAVEAVGRASGGEPIAILGGYGRFSELSERWAELIGIRLERLGGVFAHSERRSSLKVRLLLQGNPFLAWFLHHEDLCGEIGDEALAICSEAFHIAPGDAERGVTTFIRNAISFVRLAEQARGAYSEGRVEESVSALSSARGLFDELERVAMKSAERIGGSLADIERCKVARRAIESAIHRIRHYGDGSLGYLPAFEHITHPNFVPHDQGAWWLINKWGQF